MKIKFLFTLLVSFSIIGISQTKKELKIKKFFWGENDTHKNIIEIPSKWKNESAVIIYKNQNYDFHKFAKNVTYTTSTRKRIKLLDKSAVKTFSEFSFSDLFRPPNKVIIFPIPIAFKIKQDTGNYVGIKIIKPNGEEIEIDVRNESVQEDNETKIAISNLEVGDIIDYYIYKELPFRSVEAFGFKPVEIALGENYPILDFKLFFETENDFFINFNSFNGAPNLQDIPTEKKSIRRYSLEASHIEKTNSQRWLYPLVELPAYKFQVFFARSGKFENRAVAFLPEKEKIIKKKVSKEEVLDLYDKRFKPDGNNAEIKYFLKGKTFNSNKEKVEAVYYYMRHAYFSQYVEAYNYKEAGIISFPFNYYPRATLIDNQKRFIKFFTAFLKQQKIDYEIIVAKKRFDGTIDDLLIEENVNLLLKVNTKTPIYIDYFGLHSSINQYSPLIENTDIYLLSASKNKIDYIKRGKLSGTTYLDNQSEKEITLTFDNDFSGINIKTKNNYKGHQKKDIQFNRLLFTDYVYDDYKKYEFPPFIDYIRKKKEKIKVQKQIDALIEKLETERLEKFKKAAKSKYNLTQIDDYKFKIDSTGRYGFHSNLTYTESFSTKNTLLKKAGPNYIVEIGKLITEQIDLTDKQRKRTENIYMSYPRSYNNTITFIIPDGYTISGIDKLNMNINNSTGAFVSNAKIDTGKLIITTSKIYKNNYEPNLNWNLMVEFLDAANQFTNEKILLKKI